MASQARIDGGASSSGHPHYDAFISYSHAKDRLVAAAVQRGLHRLARRWYQVRALRVFRDDTSLSASPHLWTSIEQALDGSRFFVLMASPEAARSPWVQREIAFWQGCRAPDTFLIVVTAGEIHWDTERGDFDWTQTSALPRGLSGWFPSEPLWVVLEEGRDETGLSLRNSRFRAAVCKLAAPIRGMPPDELDGEDIRQHRLATRLRRAAVGALSLLLVTVTALGIVAVQQRGIAVDQRDRAEREARVALARAAAAEGDVLAARDPVLAARLAVAAYRLDASPQTMAALMRAMDRHRHEAGFVEREADRTGAEGRSFADTRAGDVEISPDGTVVAVSARQNGDVRLWDVSSNRLVATLRTEFGGSGEISPILSFTADGTRLVVKHGHGTEIWRLADRTRIFRRKATERISLGPVSADGQTIGVSFRDEQLHIVSTFITSTDRPDAALTPVADGPSSWNALRARVLGRQAAADFLSAGNRVGPVVNAEGNRAAVVSLETNVLEMWDVGNRRRLASRQLPGNTGTGKWAGVEISDDGRTVVAGDDRGQLVALDGQLSRTWTLGQLPGTVMYLDVNRDGSLAVAADNTGNVLLLRPTVDRRFDVLPNTELITTTNNPEPDLIPSPDGRWLLIVRTGRVELWRLDQRREIADFPIESRDWRVTLPVPVAAFSSDGGRFAVLGHGRVIARELESLREVANEPAGQDSVATARAFAIALGGDIQMIRRESDEQHGEVVAVGRTGQGQVVVTGPRQGLWVTRPGPVVAVMAPQGDANDRPRRGRISVWALQGRSVAERIGELDYEELSVVMSVSGDGKHLVIGGVKREAELIDVQTGKRTTLSGGQGRGALVNTEYAFLGTSGLIAQFVTPDRNANEIFNRLLLWHDDTGTLVGEWEEPGGGPLPDVGFYQVVPAGDGTALTLRADGSVVAWHTSPEAWVANLCQLFGDLDPAQRQRYLPAVNAPPGCSGAR